MPAERAANVSLIIEAAFKFLDEQLPAPPDEQPQVVIERARLLVALV
jgi:hypothetical protein